MPAAGLALTPAPARAQTTGYGLTSSFCLANPGACQAPAATGYGSPYAGPYGYNSGFANPWQAPPGYGYGYGYPYPGAPNPALAAMTGPAMTGPAMPGGQPPLPASAAGAAPAGAGEGPPAPSASGTLPVPAADPRFYDPQRYTPDRFGQAGRPRLIQRAAHGAGVRAGYAEESARIAAHLITPAVAARLEARYPFAGLMIQGGIVPPVITRLDHVAKIDNERLVRTTLGSFEIVRPARLTLAEPSWRDYLIAPGEAAPAPEEAVPRNAAERRQWDGAFEEARDTGIREARAAFSDNLKRLARDFAGMQRYRELAAAGAVSLPEVSRASKAVRIGPGGQSAAIGERVIRLTVAPKFRPAKAKAFK